jgi:outer membrane protein assembly factor BamB
MNLRATRSLTLIAVALLCAATLAAADWTNWRGPNRDGHSPETGLPESWSPDGENLLWKAPYPGRSTPVIRGNRLYALNSAGEAEKRQERIVCLDANTGKEIWEYRYNVYHSDAPPRRIAWSAPVIDPQNGNVYTYGVAGVLTALTEDGELIWQRSLSEEFNTISTHGGRTVSPIIEGDLVIASGVTLMWGKHSPPRHRFFAFDKVTGECVWLTSPGVQPFDTTYSTPIVTEISGTRLMISGSGDGSVVALKPLTGEKVWRYPMSKRGVNTEVVVHDNIVFVSHGEENLGTSEMGLLAAVDATSEGDLQPGDAKWSVPGFLAGYSSPVINDGVIYQVDNGSNLYAFDVKTGEELWVQNLGTIQRASSVFGDGKIYVGNDNGDFFILKPTREGCEILDKDRLGGADSPERITASAAISNGRVFVVTDTAMYAFGKDTGAKEQPRPRRRTKVEGPPTHLRVSPTEMTLAPGDTVQLHAWMFNEAGLPMLEGETTWNLAGVKGTISADGKLTIAADAPSGAGAIKAVSKYHEMTVDGEARLRVIAPLPWSENFDDRKPGLPPSQWVNAGIKFEVREMDGGNVLVKLANNPASQRARVYMGPANWHDYTVEADVSATEKRRQMGDAGVVGQRYVLVLFGNHQRLEIHPWQADPTRTVKTNFAWNPDTWYSMKLRVENLADGNVKLQGKAWPRDEDEPEAWTLEHIDQVPNREGTPGLYADAPFEVIFDNYRVTPNE